MARELNAGTLGSLKRFTFVCSYEGLFGWRVRFTHMHEGEDLGCTHKVTYEGLSMMEMVDVLIAHTLEANSRYTWDSTDCSCHPAGTPGSVGNALKLRP